MRLVALEPKPLIEDVRWLHFSPEESDEARRFLDELLQSGKCKKVRIVTGEKKIFKTDRFVNSCRAGIESNPALEIEIVAHLQSKDLQSISKKLAGIRPHVKLYVSKKYPQLHYWLVVTMDRKAVLYLQRIHVDNDPTEREKADKYIKDEYITENPYFLRWKYLLNFKLRKSKLASRKLVSGLEETK